MDSSFYLGVTLAASVFAVAIAGLAAWLKPWRE
jgi:hypothetical protein